MCKLTLDGLYTTVNAVNVLCEEETCLGLGVSLFDLHLVTQSFLDKLGNLKVTKV